MNEKCGYTGGQVFLAFLGGAAAGAAVALLTAPRSGSETRQLLGNAVGKGKGAAKRIPEASRLAAEAANEAFAEGMKSG